MLIEQKNTGEKVKGRQEVLIDFEGTSNRESEYEKVVVPNDVYTSRIQSVVIQETKKFGEEGTEPTIIIQVEPVVGKGSVPLFVKPKITKAYKQGVSNSKLYDILVLAGLLEDAQAAEKQLSTLDGLEAWLVDNLVGREVRYLTKTSKDGSYSRVDRVLGFTPSPATA